MNRLPEPSEVVAFLLAGRAGGSTGVTVILDLGLRRAEDSVELVIPFAELGAGALGNFSRARRRLRALLAFLQLLHWCHSEPPLDPSSGTTLAAFGSKSRGSPP